MSQPSVTAEPAPPPPVSRQPAQPSRRWTGIALLFAGVGYVLTLGTLRDTLVRVPDVAWFVVLATLFGAGGALTARGLAPVDVAPPNALRSRAPLDRLARRRLLARAAVLVGAAGLSAGAASSTGHAAAWSDAEHAAGALAFCAALALVPFGVALLWRTARETRTAHDAATLEGAPRAPRASSERAP